MDSIFKRCRLYPLYRAGLTDGLAMGCFAGAFGVIAAIILGLYFGVFQ